MALNYKEMNFEEHIEAHLLNSGYRKRAPAEYNQALGSPPASSRAAAFAPAQFWGHIARPRFVSA